MHPAAAQLDLLDEPADLIDVGRPDRVRVELYVVLADLQVAKVAPAVEREVQLLVGHHVQQDHLVLLVTEVMQGLEHLLRVVEQVGDDDDQPATVYPFGYVVEDGCKCGLVAGFRLVKLLKDRPQVPAAAARGNITADRGVERYESDRVLLVDHQVCQRRRQALGVLKLAERPVVAPGGGVAGVFHRAGGVDQDCRPQVGLLDVLLDVVPVGLGQHAPVEVADVVAGGILAVLGELDGKALVGALVPAGDKPLDHPAGDQLQAADLGQRVGVQQVHVMRLVGRQRRHGLGLTNLSRRRRQGARRPAGP